MTLKKAKKLMYGDTIGIVSPSDSVNPKLFPKRISRAIQTITKMGFKIKLGKYIYDNNSALISPEKRASDINDMFEDKEVKAILTTWGGLCANQILPLLDYNLIKSKPKIIMGYSDTTAIINTILSKSNLVTFHGPALLKEFGEFPQPFEYTINSFEQAVMNETLSIQLNPPTQWTDEWLEWDKNDYARSRKLNKNNGWHFFGDGNPVGKLVGGNLPTITALTGTEYLPELNGAILILEDIIPKNQDLRYIFRELSHLEQVGVFEEIKGILFGKNSNCLPVTEKILNKKFVSIAKKYNFPIVTAVDFGHTDPKLTLPLGIKVKIDSNEKKISLLESGVSP